jgi:hypothetical protein
MVIDALRTEPNMSVPKLAEQTEIDGEAASDLG